MPLPERDTRTVQAAADAFLSSPRYANPNTRHGYTGVLDRLLAGLGASRPLAEVSGEELAGRRSNSGGSGPRRPGTATAAPWPPGCPGAPPAAARPVLPASAERRREHLNATRAVPRPAIERALSRRDVPLREKTLWRMLYETAARASEVLALNIDDLDLDARRARFAPRAATPNGSAGAPAPRTCWPASSAAARPGRCSCPGAAPAPPAARAARDLCPATGRARLGCDRARILFTRYTGWQLHQLRHSAATHLGEKGIPLQLIMAKTRHRNPRTAMRYVRPGAEAVAEITGLLEPPRRRG